MRVRYLASSYVSSCVLALMACNSSSGDDGPISADGSTFTTSSDDGITQTGEAEATGSESEASDDSSSSTGDKLDSMAEDTGADEGECAAVSEEAENEFAPVDIIFAIDTSGSMSDEKNFVQANMNLFSQQIFLANIDSHVVMIAEASPDGPCINVPLGSGACPGDTSLPEYAHIVQGVSSSNALQQIIGTHTLWAPHLRPNSVKHIVVVSDDESSLSAADFDTMFTGLDATYGNYIFHAIVAFDDPNPLECQLPGATCCAGFIPLSADVGQVYIDLASQTGGVAGDLCLQQFGPVFDEIAQSVQTTTPLSCEWDIPAPPEGQDFDPTKVNVDLILDSVDESVFFVPDETSCAGGDGWYYFPDATNPTSIRACPATCTRVQAATEARVDILFGCDTIPIG